MRAADLSPGDTVKVWWGAKSATVLNLRGHDSGIEGWKVADFADGFSMTITPFMVIEHQPIGNMVDDNTNGEQR